MMLIINLTLTWAQYAQLVGQIVSHMLIIRYAHFLEPVGYANRPWGDGLNFS
jgi:cytochrome bd-type quinol oxidase subunit 1